MGELRFLIRMFVTIYRRVFNLENRTMTLLALALAANGTRVKSNPRVRY
jgi:hypothetical protein